MKSHTLQCLEYNTNHDPLLSQYVCICRAMNVAPTIQYSSNPPATQGTAANAPMRPHGKADDKVSAWQGTVGYFPRALKALAELSEQGANAPGRHWGGWLDVPDGFKVYSNALMRHVLDEARITKDGILKVEILDEVVAVAWNALARLEHLLRDIAKQPEG